MELCGLLYDRGPNPHPSYQPRTRTQQQSMFARSSLTTSDKGPPPQEETETYISTPQGLVGGRDFQIFLPIRQEFQKCLPDLSRGHAKSPHPSSSPLRRHLKTAEDPHINRSFTRTQDLPDTWLWQLRKSGKAGDSAAVRRRDWTTYHEGISFGFQVFIPTVKRWSAITRPLLYMNVTSTSCLDLYDAIHTDRATGACRRS
jgi:hypothetical protein